MWGGGAVPPPPMPVYGGAQAATTTQSQQKHDIFVGNLAFNTTEDQLHQAFSEIGRVLKVRLVTDNDTGKPRGFAFIEYEDPQAALSAIRNMNDYELNGRRVRVNFSNSSHLEALAGKLGMDLSSRDHQPASSTSGGPPRGAGSGTQTVSDALKGFSKSEAYDVVEKLKEIADRDADEARRLLSGHPQLPEAILFLMASRLDMIQTPLPSEAPPVVPTVAAPLAPAAPPRVADPRQRVDPRAAAAKASTPQVPPPPTVQPMAVDPRQRMDPRQRVAATAPPPPPPPQYGGAPPPPMQQQQPMGQPSAVANLDPSLVQQVMSLTMEQIAQLPPDKQQSILALRQQITGSR